jgi:hypothetical protein
MGASFGLQSGGAGFQTRVNAPAEFKGFKLWCMCLLNADRISSPHENSILYQGTTDGLVVGPHMLNKIWV